MALIFNVVERKSVPKRVVGRTTYKYKELDNVLNILDADNALEISMKDNPTFKYSGIYSFVRKRYGGRFVVARRKNTVGQDCIYITNR
jgi:hypothetical protein